MVNEAVALFIPLLLAVVTALCSFLRDSVDLESVVEEQRPSFVPLLSIFLPPLGRFPIIHLSNITLLLIGIVIIKDVATDDLTALIGSLILGIFSLILPILEINDYGKVLARKKSGWLYPKSYYYHCISMMFLSLTFFGFVELQVIVLNFLLSRGATVSGTLLRLINRLLEIMLFPSLSFGIFFLYLSMHALSNEFQQISSS